MILQIPPTISSMQCARTVLYCHTWPVWLYRNIIHCFTNGWNFEKKKLMNVKDVLRFSLQFLSETFLILRKYERYKIINVYWSSSKITFILVRLQYNLKFLDTSSYSTTALSVWPWLPLQLMPIPLYPMPSFSIVSHQASLNHLPRRLST
jgi:hypothetical protein